VHSDPQPGMMAGEPPHHQGEKVEPRKCSVVRSLCYKEKHYETEFNQARHRGGGSVVLSSGVHESGP